MTFTLAASRRARFGGEFLKIYSNGLKYIYMNITQLVIGNYSNIVLFWGHLQTNQWVFYIHYSMGGGGGLLGLVPASIWSVFIMWRVCLRATSRIGMRSASGHNQNHSKTNVWAYIEVRKSPEVVKSETGSDFRQGHVSSSDSSVFMNETLKPTWVKTGYFDQLSARLTHLQGATYNPKCSCFLCYSYINMSTKDSLNALNVQHVLHLSRWTLHIATLQFTRYKTILRIPNHTQNTCILTAVTAAKSVFRERPISQVI